MAMTRVRMLLLAAIACCLLMGSASAHENQTPQKIMPIDHIVGGAFGWRLPEANKTIYEDWAKPRVFGVGDTLVFPYRSGSATVAQVNKEDYDQCTMRNVIYMFVSGPSNVTLSKPGDYYFLNGNGKHCEGGQKLHVVAQAGVQGKGGVQFSFKINLSVNRKSSAGSTLKGSSAPAPSPVVAAATAPAHAPKASAATSIQNLGIASGLFTSILFSLFI